MFGLLAGCISGQYAEKPSGQKLEDTDEFKIDAVVYAYLLQRHDWNAGGYTAIFLKGSDAEVARMMRIFSDHVPPIKSSERAELHPTWAPIDRDTGKSAVILSVDAMDSTNGMVEAIGRWYAGVLMSGFHVFELGKIDGEWKVQSVK